jgi:hypothetical protein
MLVKYGAVLAVLPLAGLLGIRVERQPNAVHPELLARHHAIPGLVAHRGHGVGLEPLRARAVDEDRQRPQRLERAREQRRRARCPTRRR